MIGDETDKRESRLPLWAQKRLNDLRYKLYLSEKAIEDIKSAHVVLTEKEWFAIHGPGVSSDRETYTLYILNRDDAVRVATLGRNDTLLVGRASKKEPKSS